MHTDFAPDEVTEDYIELVCDDLRDKLNNVLNNHGDLESYDEACQQLNHIGAMLDDIFIED